MVRTRKALLLGGGAVFVLLLLLAWQRPTPCKPPAMLFLTGAAACGGLYALACLCGKKGREPGRWAMPAVLLAALLLRLLCMRYYFGYESDFSMFTYWATHLFKYGPAQFYTAGFFADYPPGYLYVLWGAQALNEALGLAPVSAAGQFVLSLPPVLCDLALAALLYRVARARFGRRFALGIGALTAFAPAFLYNSGVWRQVDSALALVLCLCFLALQNKRYLGAAALYALALLLKPQALLFGPVLAVGFLLPVFGELRDGRWKGALRGCLGAAGCGTLCLFLLWLGGRPFQGTQGPLWQLDKYLFSANLYPYATINGYNLFFALGGNWQPQESGWLLSYQQWGMLFLAAVTCLLLFLAYRLHQKGSLNLPLLAGFYGLAVFTFIHIMHERYSLPGLALLLLACAMLGGRRLLRCAVCQCFLSYMNISLVLLSFETPTVAGHPLFNGMARVCSAGQVVLVLYLCWVLLDGALGLRARLRAAAPVRRLAAALAAPPAGPQPWGRRDVWCLLLPTLACAALSFARLGAVSAPQTAWRGGEAALEVQGAGGLLWVYGGLGEGALQVLGERGAVLAEVPMQQGNLFNWQATPLPEGASPRAVRALGPITVYEICFTGPGGAPGPRGPIRRAPPCSTSRGRAPPTPAPTAACISTRFTTPARPMNICTACPPTKIPTRPWARCSLAPG